VPIAHAEHAVPVSENCPAVQLVHAVTAVDFTGLDFPATHRLQTAVPAPEYCPTGQSMHTDAPTDEYWPATQAVHAVPIVENCPAAHCVQSVARVDAAGHDEPAAHLAQAVVFVAVAYWPATQSTHADALAAAAKRPMGHTVQNVNPAEPLNCPAAQGKHAVPPVEYCPAAQLRHAATLPEPAGQLVPAAHREQLPAPAAATY
jgi:hypothetical protein